MGRIDRLAIVLIAVEIAALVANLVALLPHAEYQIVALTCGIAMVGLLALDLLTWGAGR